MKQHEVYFSIGSNLGDRLNYLQQAVQAIHQKIGWVTHVSAVYETAAWGFSSTPFYNAVVRVNTYKTPSQLRLLFLEIETTLGRIRKDDSGYSARTIDIDVLSYNQEIISTIELSIPHPLLHQRQFVLIPFLEIAPDWYHPVLAAPLSELSAKSEDTSAAHRVACLKNPADDFVFENLHFLAIEGNIGAGKTTLTQKIAEDFQAMPLYEGFADNPFLPKFYENPARYALPLEMSFLAERYAQLSENLNQLQLFHSFTVSDYYILKSLIFAQVTLEKDEYQLFKNIFDIMYHQAQKPDLYVFLQQNTDQLLVQIQHRGRSYEQDIASDYLASINQGYLKFIQTLPKEHTLIIDMTHRDFVKNQEDYLYVLQCIQNKWNSR